MSSGFLESNNITSLINTVRSNVNQEINFDITSEPKYINVLKKLVKTIHKANIDKPVSTEYMNDLVINKCVPFLVNQVKKNRNNQSSNRANNVFGNLPLQTSERPTATRMNDSGISKQNSMPSVNASSDFSGLTLAGELPLNNPYTNNQNQGFDLPPRQMPNLTNMPEQGGTNLPPGSGQNMQSMLEPPSRQMPSLNQNQNQNNMQMNIANLPAPDNLGAPFNSKPDNTQLSTNNMAGVNSKEVGETIDFAKRLEEMQKEREYDNEEANKMDEFNKQNSQINMAGQEALQQRDAIQTENKNEFFRKLAENNNQNMEETRARDNELYDMNNSNLQKNYMDDSLDLDDSMYSAYNNNTLQLGERNASQAQEQITNLENNIRDSTRLVNGGENSGISEMIKNREGEISKDKSKEYIDTTFLSTNFQYERRKRKIVCLDISDNLLDLANGNDTDGTPLTKNSIDNISNTFWGRFKVELAETLVIDKLSDVFIESIIVNNPAQASRFSNLYMVIDIEEFNIKTATNNSRMMDKFVLPNENTDSAGSTKIMKYHLKSNYVATVNPTTLRSLTFNITNEDGDSVQSQFTTSERATTAVTNVGSSAAIALNNDGQANPFVVLDAVYNSSQQFVGNVGQITDDGADDTITLTRPTNVHLYEGETLFFPSSRTTLRLNANGAVGDTTINLGADPTNIFNVGNSVYLGTGAIIGKVASIDGTADTITFEQGITQFIPSGAALYNENPLPRVFASNEKSNRIILELVIMSR